MAIVAMPRIPMLTMTAKTIRMTLSALLPPLGGGAGVDDAGTGEAADGVAAMAAPHLLQNCVPSVRVAPQELQNAIGHLEVMSMSTLNARVYRRWAVETAAERQRLKAILVRRSYGIAEAMP